MAKVKICKIEGCGKPVGKRLTLCWKHYKRLRRYGDPLGGGTAQGEAFEWLKKRVDYYGNDCLIWPFERYNRGYGRLKYLGHNITANRLMCIFAYGDPPANNYDAAHSCGNGRLGCVNPKHLRWATRQENVDDMKIHGTTLRGETASTVKLTEPKVRQIRALEGTMSQIDIGKMFGVSRTTVGMILQRKRWGWLT
jgi:hypothetical protein